jgi:prepilin-type processing-associated H-X9-DG protein
MNNPYGKPAITLGQILMIAAIPMFLVFLILYPVFAPPPRRGKNASAQNCRQLALGAIMYGGDYDDTIPLTINGWLSRMQNVGDDQLTVNCPGPGTQDLPALHAAGGRRTDAWPLLIVPYVKSRGLYVQPERGDIHQIWTGPAKSVGEPGYNAEGATERNQNRFPMYGMNYMFLSPMRIPKSKRGLPDAVNYAVSEAHTFTEADDPSDTVFFTESRHSMSDSSRGFFVINAPGMWPVFSTGKNGLVAFWSGTAGSGDWVGTNTACADYGDPCLNPQTSTGFVYGGLIYGYTGGSSVTFLDGHVKSMKTALIASGTDYLTATAAADGSGAHIIDKKKYLWNVSDKNYYGM